nr:putative ribonuclease H-like domain-containing protein [Tanacetum cinerariifolium]
MSKDPEVPVAPTTTKQRLAKKNELKARETLLMDLLDKHQLKFNIHKDAKSLIKAIEKQFDSTNESVSAITSVSSASTKVPVSALPNVDNLSDAVIYSFFANQSNSPQLDNDDLKQIDVDDLEEIDLKWHMAMLTMRARRFLYRTRRNLGANGTTSIGFDMSKVECYNCHRRGHFARECRSPKDTRNKETQRRNVPVETSTSNALVSQYDGLEFVEARLVVYQRNENVFKEDIKLLKFDVMLRDNALVELRKKFEKAEQERDELKLKLENFQTSSKNLSKLLASQITDKTGLGYDNQVFNSTMFDYDELISSESDVSMPTSPMHDRYKLGDGYHVVPPPYTATFMPPKPDLVFHDASIVNETVPIVLNVKPIPTKPNKDFSQSNRPSAPIIEDWVSDSEDESEGEHMPTQKAPSFVQTFEHVKTPRPFVKPFEHPIPTENLKKDIPKIVVPAAVLTRSRLVPLTTARPITTDVPQTQVQHQRPTKHGVIKSNPHHALKDKGVIDSGCSRHMTGNISYLSEFKEINGGYVAFDGNPKGGNITGKDTECIVLSSYFKLLDENHMLLRVLRENNMYNVDLKNVIPLGDLTFLFAKSTLNESNLWHRRLGYINFKTMNKLVKSNLVRGLPSKVFKNNHTCVACKKDKQHRAFCKFDGKADEGFLVGYSSMNYQSVVAGNQPNSSVGIQEHFDTDKVGEGNVQQYVLFPLWSTGFKDPQNTDADATFEVKEPESEVHVSPSSSDKTKKHDNKTKREAKGKNPVEFTSVTTVGPNSTNSTNTFSTADITYSDDEEDVGAEADFSNLETNINVSLIPTTRVHKDHHVTQIIEEPKRVHQALKDPSWIEAMQEELLQFKMQKVWVLVDLPKGFKDLDYPDKAYKVVKALYGLHQASRAWYETLANYLLENGFQRGKIDQTLFIKKQKVKRIFRYLKGKPHLVLWYLKDSPFNLVAYSDSDYAGASLDRKSTTGGCQFLGYRLKSWKCKKQTVIATSSTEVEYVAVASCCAQVLWIQNQFLDYGYNFMHTTIYIDNSSTICIIKNLVLHSKTKHIEIRHHFIRDCNDKKLIQVVKISSDNNFADLLIKAFDVERFQYLVVSIGLLNP